MLKRKILLYLACLLLALTSLGIYFFSKNTGQLKTKPVCDHCNVILISLDTLGSNHLPCYGYERNTAENLCNFANENVLFSNSFSNSGHTLPSHFSIFTSLYPNHHNMLNYDFDTASSTNKLDPNIFTMAEYFKNAKYRTISLVPLKDPTLPLDRGMERGFDDVIDEKSGWTLENWDKAIDQLIDNDKNKKSTFLFLHTYWVHDPYFVDYASEGNERIFTDDYYADIPLNLDEWDKLIIEHINKIINLYENELKGENIIDSVTGKTIVDSLKGANNITNAHRTINNLIVNSSIKHREFEFYLYEISKTKERILYTEALYDEMIYYLDQKLKIIFDLVSNTELAKNTIIIITADHGEEFMEHGMMRHPSDHLYNTTTSVPLIMYIPGIKQIKIDDLVQNIDILPTVLGLTGINKSKSNFDGIDLTDSILGKPNAIQNDFLISEGPGIDSIRNKEWKLYVKGSQSEEGVVYELYNLLKDPLEKNNLSQQEPKKLQVLQDNLDRIIYKK